jgi:hypothetical protein
MAAAARNVPGMKRFAAILLWFYCGWTAGALVDFVAGFNGLNVGPALGPIIGVAAAALFAGDPRRIIWTRGTGPSVAMTQGVQNAA